MVNKASTDASSQFLASSRHNDVARKGENLEFPLPHGTHTNCMQSLNMASCPRMSKVTPCLTSPSEIERDKIGFVLPMQKQSSLIDAHCTLLRPRLHDTHTNRLDLYLTPSFPGSPSHLPQSSMHMNLSPAHDQSFSMKNLEQLWSRLLIKNSNDENVSYVTILVHPRATIAWNQMTYTPSLPLHLKPPSQTQPWRQTKGYVRVWCIMHPYQAPLVRQRNIQESFDSVMSPEHLPEAIFCFLNLSKVNFTLREEEPKLYIIMFSNPSLPFIMSVTYWARLGELEPMYRIKTTTARHQCITRSTMRTSRTMGVPNDYLNPNSSSMKLVVWNYQGTCVG